MGQPLILGLFAAIILFVLLTISLAFFMENEDAKHRNGDYTHLTWICNGLALITFALIAAALFLKTPQP